jgi:hypothetical protein
MHDAADGRWLTYAELAEARGITRKAAARLTLRHKWRRQPANDGTVKVWVPDASMSHRQAGGQSPSQTPRHDAEPTLIAQAVAALETAVFSLTTRAEQAEARATAAEARATAAEEGRQKALERLQAMEGMETARKAGSRLRRAWDGWRGR